VGTMKNMAKVELHRLNASEKSQQQAYATSLQAISLFKQKFPALEPMKTKQKNRLVILGSERGFCGSFNEQIYRWHFNQSGAMDHPIIVGNRLLEKFDEAMAAVHFPGPATIDEVLTCSQRIMEYLSAGELPDDLIIVHHDTHTISRTSLMSEATSYTGEQAPFIHTYMAPDQLHEQLHWQCLQQGLIYYLLSSLKNENHFRLQQMEGASDHLQTLMHNLRLHSNAIRQQEIIEEIEILCSEQIFSVDFKGMRP